MARRQRPTAITAHRWAPIRSLNTPIGAAFRANGSLAYIPSNNCQAFPCMVPGTVSVVETANGQVAATVPVGFNPQGVSITPRRHRRGFARRRPVRHRPPRIFRRQKMISI